MTNPRSAFLLAFMPLFAAASSTSAALIDATNSGAIWTVTPGSTLLLSVSISDAGSELATAANLVLEVRQAGAAAPVAGDPAFSANPTWLSGGHVFDGYISLGANTPAPQTFQEGAFSFGSGVGLNGTLASVSINTNATHAGNLYDLAISTTNESISSMSRVTSFSDSLSQPISYTTALDGGIIGQFRMIPEPAAIVQLLGLAGTGGLFAGYRLLRLRRSRRKGPK